MTDLALSLVGGGPFQVLYDSVKTSIRETRKFRTKLEMIGSTLEFIRVLEPIRANSVQAGLSNRIPPDLIAKVAASKRLIDNLEKISMCTIHLHLWGKCCNCPEPNYADQLDDLDRSLKDFLHHLKVEEYENSACLYLNVVTLIQRTSEFDRRLQEIENGIRGDRQVIQRIQENGPHTDGSGGGGGLNVGTFLQQTSEIHRRLQVIENGISEYQQVIQSIQENGPHTNGGGRGRGRGDGGGGGGGGGGEEEEEGGGRRIYVGAAFEMPDGAVALLRRRRKVRGGRGGGMHDINLGAAFEMLDGAVALVGGEAEGGGGGRRYASDLRAAFGKLVDVVGGGGRRYASDLRAAFGKLVDVVGGQGRGAEEGGGAEGGGERDASDLGAACGKLVDVVIKVKAKNSIYKRLFGELKSSLDYLKPLIEAMSKQNKVVHLPNQEVQTFISEMANGIELVLKCSRVRKWSNYKKYEYIDRLLRLDGYLLRFFIELKGLVEMNVKEITDSITSIEAVIQQIEEGDVVQNSEIQSEPPPPAVELDVLLNVQEATDLIKETLEPATSTEVGVVATQGRELVVDSTRNVQVTTDVKETLVDSAGIIEEGFKPSEANKTDIASPPPSSILKYDVFLSFQGIDTHKNFTDHLYSALKDKGIFTFSDDGELERGESISPNLLKAIEESRCAVVVFSRNYANSSWCLDEVAKIVECMEAMGQVVIPVFYDVDPSDVRKQSGNHFGIAFMEHQKRFEHNPEKVQRWKHALYRVANLSGLLVKDGNESKVIRDIVEHLVGILTSSDLP